MSSPYRKRRPNSPSPPPRPAKSSKSQPPIFASHLTTTATLSPTVRRLCDLISSAPSSAIESILSSSSSLSTLSLSPSDVETVLKFSYASPSSALKFFRWASSRFPPTPYAWNLVVDLLGKNVLFSPMWDAIQSMHSQSLLSLATFASVFSSYAAAGSFSNAIQAFDWMEDRFGIKKDVAALNSLLSALCREGHTHVARDFLKTTKQDLKQDLRPDGDSYAILLEGWENEGDARRARHTFDEMVERFGWDPLNVPAYDSILCALLKDSKSDALRYLVLLRDKRCFPGMKFFRKAMAEFERTEDAKGAGVLWNSLAGRNGCYPDAKLCHSMVELQCRGGRPEGALKYLDEMVCYGVFPDEKTYNVVLECLLKERKVKEAGAIFNEMVKNECKPSESNCKLAVKSFLITSSWEEMGIKVWKCMADNGYPSEEIANTVVDKLHVFKLPEACKFAEEIIDRRVKLSSSNLSKLRAGLLKLGKGNIYDNILLKWKSHQGTM